MIVTPQVKKRVEAKLKEGLKTLNTHYKTSMSMPRVTYKVRGSTAGKADYSKWEVMLNAVLLMENIDDFIERTVPHELAHLGAFKVYPETLNRFADEAGAMFRMLRVRRGKLRMPKREVHGPRWQEVMRVLGVKDSSRTHTYDVSNSSRRKARYDYKCSGCGTAMKCGPKIHKQIQADPKSRWHRGCKGSPLVLVTSTPAKPAATYKPKTTPKTKAPKSGTKLARSYVLYKQWKHLYDRKGMIAVFRNELGMTEAGSSTYVYQCQKLYQQGV